MRHPRTWQSLGATVYDVVMWPLEAGRGRRWRARLWEGVSGRVLEIGAGTGANFPFYPPGARVVAVELGEGMLARARRRAARAGIGVELVPGDIHALPFPDGDFDFVVGSFVLCSVRDPLAALAEVRRVLSPSGEARFLEHVRPRGERLARVLDRVAPHFAKRTWELFPRAGFEVVSEECLDSRGLVRFYRLRKS
ncbi:MAG: class I SAM-dependent methyltransferase [Caldiserica bacterium]|nr:class I SAM-dependent methyltransferase [Caldisericota bacterium]